MKNALLAIFLALPASSLLHAQGPAPVPCKATLIGSANMKILYGGRTTLFQGRRVCKNLSLSPSALITAADFDLNLPTVALVPGSIAQTALTSTYNRNPIQEFGRGANLSVGVMGVLVAAKVISIGSGPLGLAIAAVVAVTQYLVPALTAGEPALDFSNQCSNLAAMSLAPGATITCDMYIQKPGKGQTLLPSSLNFTVGTSVLPTPFPLPLPVPVQLRRPDGHEDTAIQGIGDGGQFGGNSNLEFKVDSKGGSSVRVDPPVDYDTERLVKVMKAKQDAYYVAPAETHPQLEIQTGAVIPLSRGDRQDQPAHFTARAPAPERIESVKSFAPTSPAPSDIQQLRETVKAMQAQLNVIALQLDKIQPQESNQ